MEYEMFEDYWIDTEINGSLFPPQNKKVHWDFSWLSQCSFRKKKESEIVRYYELKMARNTFRIVCYDLTIPSQNFETF